MARKSCSIAERIKEKWFNRLGQQNENPRYVECGKTSITCKCPKCGQHHKTFMNWSGRGIPRIYCSLCRPVVATICELGVECTGASITKGARKLAPMAID
jgi:hypothetical protein